MYKIRLAFSIFLLALILVSCSITEPSAQTPLPSATVPVSTETAPPAAGGSITACPPDALPNPDWPYYCGGDGRFFVQYPDDAEFSEGDMGVPRISLSVLPGTNLGEKYVDIAAQSGLETCTSPLTDGYVPEMVQTEQVEINGLTFRKESGADAGAGNYYNWTAFSTEKDGLCVSLSFVLHSTNPSNYPTPPPEYDAEAESAVMDEMLDTFRWVEE